MTPEKHWPDGSAIGKLNIVTAEGKDPRQVLDSTVCNANPLCKVPERVSLPNALDVQRTFLRNDKRGNFMGLSLDFKAAHKCAKVLPLIPSGIQTLPLRGVPFRGKIQSILLATCRRPTPAHRARTSAPV